MMKCGQQRCACHQDPAKRHGPYFEWTYKEKGKTVNRRLRPEEAPIFSRSDSTIPQAAIRIETNGKIVAQCGDAVSPDAR